MKEEATEFVKTLAAWAIDGVVSPGTVVVNAFSAMLARHSRKNVETLMARLRGKVKRLEGRIARGSLDENQFANIAKTAMQIAERSSDQARLDAAAAILANSLLEEGDPDKLEFTELDYFGRCLERVSGLALEVLRKLAADGPLMAVPEGEVKEEKLAGRSRITAGLRELEGLGFATSEQQPRYREEQDEQGRRPVLMGNPRLGVPMVTIFSLTVVGQRFVDHVLQEGV